MFYDAKLQFGSFSANSGSLTFVSDWRERRHNTIKACFIHMVHINIVDDDEDDEGVV